MDISKLETMLEQSLARGQDNPLLRFSLGNLYLKQKDYQAAAKHLQAAVKLQPDYTAAWKALGKALAGAEDHTAAIQAYQQGIKVAQEQGDKQAEKEMQVFLRRLSK